MTDGHDRDDIDGDDDGVPDTDPRRLDPAGDLAGAFEAGEFDAELTGDTGREQLEEFIRRAEAGEFGPADPGLEATVKIARSLLEATEGEDE